MRFLLVVAFTACQGESVTSKTVDAAGTDTSCGGDATNLLQNASFEDWVGSSPEHWTTDGGVYDRGDDGAPHCARYARFANTCYNTANQVITFATPLPVGTVLEYGATIRHIDGTRKNVQVQITDGELDIAGTGELPVPDGTAWKAYGATYTLKEARSKIGLRIPMLCEKQTIGIDQAFIRVRR